jgi:FMN phosphatase YigB (HAD superfamily)
VRIVTAVCGYDPVPAVTAVTASGGIRIALVSNCAENTRQLLSSLGASEMAEAVALSCEVGCAKPDAPIYQHALGLLGVCGRRGVRRRSARLLRRELPRIPAPERMPP